MLNPVRNAADKATDTLLLYYAGHGLVDPRGGRLHLTLVASDPKRIYTAVPYGHIRDALLDSRAARRLVILDCCYSGRALGTMADPITALVDEASVEGSYILAATPENEAALAPPGETYTAFTAELLDLFHRGIPGRGELLELDTIYNHVRAIMLSKGRPLPQKRDRNTAGQLTLIRNRAYRGIPQVYAGNERTPPAASQSVPIQPFGRLRAETAPKPNPAVVHPPASPTIPARNEDFRQALRHLYEGAGRPPTGNLVLPDGKRLLPGQAEEVLKAKKLPPWSRAQPVIIALGGNAQAFQQLWSRRPDPERISTPQEAAAGLQDIHTIAGQPDGYKFLLRLRGRELLSRAWFEIDGFLAACGVPPAEITRWETAWEWIRKTPGPITARQLLRIIGISLVVTAGAVIPFLLGDAVRHWGHHPLLGGGNYLALVPSLAVIVVVAGAFVGVTQELAFQMRYRPKYNLVTENRVALVIIAYIILLGLGLLLTPSNGWLAHLGEIVRDWVGWRF